MAITSFASKLWNWLINRSPRNAAQPNPTAPSDQQASGQASAYNNRPFETYIETQSIQGFQTKVGWQESGVKTPDGELFRSRETFALTLGCGHIVNQQQQADQQDRHVRGIAGICFYCQQELLKALIRGEITPFDAERLSLVCSDCGKITISGQLCCPKHYTAIANPDGTVIYLGPEDVKEQERKQLTIRFFGPILDLFLEGEPETEKPNTREQDNAKSNA
jgi:hypothetical protein